MDTRAFVRTHLAYRERRVRAYYSYRAFTTCAVSSWESEELDERPLSLAALMAVSVIVIGCFYLASPERISGSFGLKPPASDADSKTVPRPQSISRCRESEGSVPCGSCFPRFRAFFLRREAGADCPPHIYFQTSRRERLRSLDRHLGTGHSAGQTMFANC